MRRGMRSETSATSYERGPCGVSPRRRSPYSLRVRERGENSTLSTAACVEMPSPEMPMFWMPRCTCPSTRGLRPNISPITPTATIMTMAAARYAFFIQDSPAWARHSLCALDYKYSASITRLPRLPLPCFRQPCAVYSTRWWQPMLTLLRSAAWVMIYDVCEPWKRSTSRREMRVRL